MRHRRALKGIACGFIDSFVSRNNDVSGYWGIGKLYREALERPASSICIELLDPTGLPDGSASRAVQSHYLGRLAHLASKAGVSLSQARVLVEFGTFGSCAPPRWQSNGDPFVCTISLVDSKGQTYEAARAGHCSPHDPTRESRSNRASAP